MHKPLILALASYHRSYCCLVVSCIAFCDIDVRAKFGDGLTRKEVVVVIVVAIVLLECVLFFLSSSLR